MTFNPSLRNALFFFAFGFLFGLFISYLWAQMLIPEYLPTAPIESPKKLVKEVAKSETAFLKKEDMLNGESQKLKTELNSTKAALTKAKERTGELQKQVFALLDERFTMQQQAKTETVCDSLAIKVPILIAASEEKDSLYNSALANLEGQVQNRDSTISLQGLQYAELKSAFSKSIEGQTFLTNEDKVLTKSFRQQRTKSKVVSAALCILSGAAATYLLHH